MEVESSAEVPVVAVEDADFLCWVIFEADECFVELAGCRAIYCSKGSQVSSTFDYLSVCTEY